MESRQQTDIRMVSKIARCSQGFFQESTTRLCLGFGGQLREVIALALGDVLLALLEGLLGLVPSLLGDLLSGLLGVARIRTDGGVGFLVDVFNLWVEGISLEKG
jgi:hypothetical protein